MKRLFYLSSIALLIVPLCSCYSNQELEEIRTRAFNEGFESGYSEGYDDGYSDSIAENTPGDAIRKEAESWERSYEMTLDEAAGLLADSAYGIRCIPQEQLIDAIDMLGAFCEEVRHMD